MEKIRLHANENWFNPLTKIKKDLVERISSIDLQKYPDPDAWTLKEKLSEYTSVPKEELICTNGSDELIKIIFEAFSKAGDTVVVHSPTFLEYELMADIRGCKTISIAPKADLTPDIDTLIQTAKDQNAALTFICNPNNPTGYLFSKKDLERIIESIPGMVVIDEAYAEFSEVSIIGKSYNKDKVIIMRTLSKAFGAAALRVGYGIAKPELIQKMNKVKMPYNLSTVAQESAICLLENQEILNDVVQDIRRERMRLYGVLSTFTDLTDNFEVFPSYGNYIMLRSDKAQAIYNALDEAGYKVRIFEHDPNLKNCLRFSVTEATTNNEVADIIRKVVTQ